MLKPRTRRAILRRLAYLFEDWAEALHRKAERPARPRPLRFPTDGELMIDAMIERSVRKAAKDLAFMRSPMWDRGAVIGDSLKVRLPNSYLPGRIDE